MLARFLRPLVLSAAALWLLPAGASAAKPTPVNWLTGEPDKASALNCATNGRSGTFAISGPSTKGLVGKFTGSGSAAFGPPDENGFGAVTSLKMKFHFKGPAGEVDGTMSGGSPQYSLQDNWGGCGDDEDFGYSLYISQTKHVTWTGTVKSRFGTYQDHGAANVNGFSVYYSKGKLTADGIAPNLTSNVTGKPVNVNAPRLTGDPKVGGRVSCSGGDWIGAFGVSKFEWLRDGAVVATASGGKPSVDYTVQAADATHTLRCRTTADRGFGLDAVTALSNTALVGGCLVPNLHGMTVQGAKTALEKVRCALGQVTKKKKKGVKKGHVLSQSPKAGATGPVGLKVAIVVRKKPQNNN